MAERFPIVAPGGVATALFLGLAAGCLMMALFAHLRWLRTRPTLLTKAALIMVAAMLGRVYWGTLHSEVVVQSDRLEFRVPAFYARTIAAKNVDWSAVRVLDWDQEPSLQPKYRTNGLGWWGYRLGWHWLKEGRKAWLAVSDPKRVVAIPQHDGLLNLVSLQDPHAFVARYAQTPSDDETTSDEGDE